MGDVAKFPPACAAYDIVIPEHNPTGDQSPPASAGQQLKRRHIILQVCAVLSIM